MSTDLHNLDTAIDFYDDRYEEGYMEEWDYSKKRKVEEIIRSLNLPPTGKALDFGCGNGVFTIIIKKCLPNWDVYGVEISDVAVKNARAKFPSCNFFSANQSEEFSHSFDFLFSHHVLEHVQSMEETFDQINEYLKPQSSQLHIFPCGNEGSYEYNICALHKDGIEKNNGNRFFFEEPGHLRRLTSEEIITILRGKQFEINKQYFANQYYGAINWITKSSPRFVKKLTNTATAIDNNAAIQLKKLRKELLSLTYAQFSYSKYWLVKSKWRKKPTDYLKLSMLLIPAMLSKKTYDKYEKLANAEWEKRKEEKNGSEMYLFFERNSR
jgi:2-polyprenyl-3-methyl-5-hydroxy-6-metoxy-1,4-benzoquinol methylase